MDPCLSSAPSAFGRMKVEQGVGNRPLEGELNIKVCQYPVGMGKLAGKLSMIDAQR